LVELCGLGGGEVEDEGDERGDREERDLRSGERRGGVAGREGEEEEFCDGQQV